MFCLGTSLLGTPGSCLDKISMLDLMMLCYLPLSVQPYIHLSMHSISLAIYFLYICCCFFPFAFCILIKFTDLNFKEKTDTVDNFSDITNWIKQKDDIHHGSSILVWHHNENIIWFLVSPWKCNSSEIFAYVDVRINSFIF